MIAWLSKLREQTLAVRAVILLLAMATLSMLVAPVAWNSAGRVGLLAAAVSSLACLVGSGLALVAGEPFRATRRVLHAMLLGTVFRMGVPLAVALIVYRSGRHLIEAGFPYYLIVFFEIALLIEVYLSMPPAAERERQSRGADEASTP